MNRPLLTMLDSHEDDRGTLTLIKNFSTQQNTFLVYGVGEDVTRGHHAHKQCQQMLICVSGECYVWAIDQTAKNGIVSLLNQPDLAFYLPPMTWAFQFGFSRDAVLLVLASHPYDKSDYITNYEEFRNDS